MPLLHSLAEQVAWPVADQAQEPARVLRAAVLRRGSVEAGPVRREPTAALRWMAVADRARSALSPEMVFEEPCSHLDRRLVSSLAEKGRIAVAAELAASQLATAVAGGSRAAAGKRAADRRDTVAQVDAALRRGSKDSWRAARLEAQDHQRTLPAPAGEMGQIDSCTIPLALHAKLRRSTRPLDIKPAKISSGRADVATRRPFGPLVGEFQRPCIAARTDSDDCNRERHACWCRKAFVRTFLSLTVAFPSAKQKLWQRRVLGANRT